MKYIAIISNSAFELEVKIIEAEDLSEASNEIEFENMNMDSSHVILPATSENVKELIKKIAKVCASLDILFR